MKIKQYEELEFTDDFMFSYAMCNNEELCRELLENILNIPIERIDFLSSQETIDSYPEAKGVRLDVYLKSSERVFNIEMQTVKKKDIPQRSRYYQSQMDTALLQKGQTYKTLADSYVIFLCMFDPFDREQYLYHFKNRCIEIPELELADGTHKVFVNAWGKEGNISSELKEFLDYMKTPGKFCEAKECSTLVSNAMREVVKGRRNKEWRVIYMTLMTKYNELLAEGREEGLVEGREEGLVEGREEGERLFANLTEILLQEGKTQDLKQAIEDKDYRDVLYRQYGILK